MSDRPALTPTDFAAAAETLGCTPAHVRAVAEVEGSRWGGFLSTGEPVILLERHWFHRLTDGRFTRDHTRISSAIPGGYGEVRIDYLAAYAERFPWIDTRRHAYRQHPRLQEAVDLDREAALKSASWGRFQIMGFNHAAAGHPTLQGFINAMYRSERDHLDAFVSFLRSKRLDAPLREGRWADFSEGYNGPRYAEHNYHGRLEAAHRRFDRGLDAPRAPEVRTA